MNAELNTLHENLGSGVTREWLCDSRIVIFTLPDTSRKAIDTWGEAVLQVIARWNPQQTYFGMQDASAPQITLTSYLRQWADRLSKESKHLRGYYTIILPRTIVAQLIKTILVNRINRQTPNLRLEFFFTREEGLAWLVQQLQKEDEAIKQ